MSIYTRVIFLDGLHKNNDFASTHSKSNQSAFYNTITKDMSIVWFNTFEKIGVATLLIQSVNLSTAEFIEPVDGVSIV